MLEEVEVKMDLETALSSLTLILPTLKSTLIVKSKHRGSKTGSNNL